MKVEQSKSLNEVERQYPDRWLAVNVEERDRNGQPAKVKVIEKNLDLYGVRNHITAEDVCILYTGSIPQSGVVLML